MHEFSSSQMQIIEKIKHKTRLRNGVDDIRTLNFKLFEEQIVVLAGNPVGATKFSSAEFETDRNYCLSSRTVGILCSALVPKLTIDTLEIN